MSESNERVLESLARCKSQFGDVLAKLAQGEDDPNEIILDENAAKESSAEE